MGSGWPLLTCSSLCRRASQVVGGPTARPDGIARPAGHKGTVAQPHTSVPDSHAVGASCLPTLYKLCPGPDGPGRGVAQAGGGGTCAWCPRPGSGIPAGGVRLACPQRRRLDYSWLTQGSLRLGLADPLGDGTARWAQELPGAGTAIGARVKFTLSRAWSQEEVTVAASPPLASRGPERLDPLRQALVDDGSDSGALGSPQGPRTPDSEALLGAAATARPWAGPTEDAEEEQEGEECPVCTEPYGPGEHRLALLNCGHGLCAGCLLRLLGAAPSADLGRVCCPLCRQKTPMLEWAICRLQEELLQADGPQRPAPAALPVPPRRGSGPWASLEHRYQLRFLPGPVGSRGCLPFLPCPPCLGSRLWALRERGPCARRLALLGLLALELLGLLLIFAPLMLLGLLFVLLDSSRR
ncbi:ring finger protein-like [Balaenoptera acutorostrata]|uniref:Ring finger protein-like n=1 Tax=Balaenoptera acutorostrata TaxID=9767 RepID=A0ABM3TSW9_BALAC|nr:ring finger protein-like [Balaenoptera acutorostrata]